MSASAIFVGIRGYVLALDRATGHELWSVSLKGSEFVNIILDGDRLFATSKGEAYCIDPQTGRILWHNPPPGYGRGLATIVTPGGTSNPMTPFAEKERQDEAARTAALIAATG